MDSVNSSHLRTMSNGQNQDTFDGLFGFEAFNKEPSVFEPTANGCQNGLQDSKCSIAPAEDIMQPISITLSMPSFHTNGNGLTNPSVFQISNNVDPALPSAEVPTQIIYTIPNFTNFVTEPIDTTVSNNTQAAALEASALNSKESTLKVAKSKAKPRSKLRTINYSNQKLILPNKEHISLQSLLSPTESPTNGIAIAPTVAANTSMKRKLVKNVTKSPKVRATVKKKIPPTETAVTGNGEFVPCFVFADRNHPESPVLLSNRSSGVFPISSSTAISESIDRVLDPSNLSIETYPSLSSPKIVSSNGILPTTEALSQDHLVAMDFNFTEYSLQGRSLDNYLSSNEEDKAKCATEPSIAQETSILRMEGDNIVYEDFVSHTKLIYNVISPEFFGLVQRIQVPTKCTPAKVASKAVSATATSGNEEKSKGKRRRGRPRRSKGKAEAKQDDQKPKEGGEKTLPCSRTRYGRLSRPPRSMKIFADVDGSLPAKSIEVNAEEANLINIVPLVVSNETHVHIDQVPPTSAIAEGSKPTAQPEVKRQRNIERFKCLTCKKVYLGENKMFKHLKAFPDHKQNTPENIPSTQNVPESFPATNPIEDAPETLSIFEELMKRVHNVPKERRTHLFLTEVSDFVERLEMLGPKLMANENINAPIEYLDKHVCKLFGIQEGNYQINEKVLEKNAKLRLSDGSFGDSHDMNHHSELNEFERHNMPNPEPLSTSSQPLEYNLNMLSLDGISNSKMNLTGSISEESLLHELVKERSKNLPDDTLSSERPVSYDHISDNAVEAVVMKRNHDHDLHANSSEPPILDLSLDLFQFNSN